MHTHTDKRMGVGETTTWLTLSRLSTTVTLTTTDHCLLFPRCFPFHSGNSWALGGHFFGFGGIAIPFTTHSSLHHGLWIWSYLALCRMLSGSRNIDSRSGTLAGGSAGPILGLTLLESWTKIQVMTCAETWWILSDWTECRVTMNTGVLQSRYQDSFAFAFASYSSTLDLKRQLPWD